MDMTYEEISEQEEPIIVKLAKMGNNKAIHRMIASIYPLIKTVAIEMSAGCDDNVSDLTNDGVIGAYRALKEFDPDLGFRFGTYAVGEYGWVRAYIQQAVYRSHLIKTSKFQRRKYGNIGSVVGFDSPVNADSDTKFGDVIADDHTESLDIKVEMDGSLRNIRTIDIFALIERMPDGIEKETIKKTACGMTVREIAEEHNASSHQKISRMVPQRNNEKAIATLKKMVMCRV